VFRCRILGGHLTINDEVSGFQWAMPEEVKTMADEAFAIRVLDALSGNQVPAIRHHDGVKLTPVLPGKPSTAQRMPRETTDRVS
jgi:hypothetical protein